MSKKERAAGEGTPTAAQSNNFNSSITEGTGNVKGNAINKLFKEDKAAKYDRYGSVMHTAVRDALCEFCRQNEEFSRAIIQTDKTLEGCLSHVAKGVKGGISDFDAFSRAVDFYFPGAKISFKMLIDVGDGVLAGEQPAPAPEPMELSLDSLMDW